MERVTSRNHHAVLMRNLPGRPLNDAFHSTRHDPMRLPDVHLRRAESKVEASSQEREQVVRSINDDVFSVWYERSRLRAPQDGTIEIDDDTRTVERLRARDYIKRSGGGARQYQEPVRRPSPPMRRPSPSTTTTEPTNPQKYDHGMPYANDHEISTLDGHSTEVHKPVPATGSRKVTRSPSPMKTERVRGPFSRFPTPSPRHSRPPSRTTSYVYGAQGLQEISTSRPTLTLNESVRSAAPQPLYGQIPTTSRSSPRKTRTKYSPPEEDWLYNPSRRDSEAVRPTYARDPFDGWQSDYDHAPRDSKEIEKAPERRAVPLQTPSPRLRSELICPTVSRDETSSEGVKNSTYIKMAMEPHVRKARMSKASHLVRPKKTSVKRNTEGVWPSYARNPSYTSQAAY
ncbi:hypothetical protein Q7P36_001123 [Cladosporium allicinum]